VANLASFLILVLFLYGRSLWRKNNLLHRKIMLTAFACDVVLVAALVVGRDALSKVGPGMSLPLSIHVPIAVTTIILYVFTVIAGIQLSKGKPTRQRLRRLDKALTTARILTFVTSVWVQLHGL
jgi:uncharacterized membrane protein YozB (DUF420 family)